MPHSNTHSDRLPSLAPRVTRFRITACARHTSPPRQGGLAIGHATLKGSVTRTGHTGWSPWDRNPGQIGTVFVGLSNGVSVAVIVTSQITAANATPNPGPPAAGFGAGMPLDATVYGVLASML